MEASSRRGPTSPPLARSMRPCRCRPSPVLLAAVLAALAPIHASARGPAAVVLLGPSGSGKSETGNTLLSDGHFKVSGGLESETLVPSANVVNFEGREWQVVDTPGYFDTTRTPEELASALERFSEIVSDHIVALAFVVPYGRFSDAHLRGWRLIRGAFGAAALKHIILIFTSCGTRTEEDVRTETAKLCSKTPAPMLCGVLEELGASSSRGGGADRIVTFGVLEPERRARDRGRLFGLAAELERAAGGKGYDHGEFVQAQARRKLMAQRIDAISSLEDRRVLELLFSNLEAGAATDDQLLRRLEQAEGISMTPKIVKVDFEDRTLGPFAQVGGGWRQPMPIPYASMRGYGTVGQSGGNMFIHTGTDSGVRLRQGDTRVGELRSAPFLLGSGRISWQVAGGGGFLAVCPADAGEELDGCLLKRARRRSIILEEEEIDSTDLSDLVGRAVYLRLVDDQKKGWGFIAVDNLEYPVLEAAAVNSTAKELPDSPAVHAPEADPSDAPQGTDSNQPATATTLMPSAAPSLASGSLVGLA